MLSSSGGALHHFGLWVNTIRCAVRSTLETMNGPADGPGPLSCPLLNASGVAVMLLGSSIVLPDNIPRRSAYGFANFTTAWRSSTPRVTDSTRSAPLGLALAKALSLPLVAWIWAAISSHVIGVPSLQTALGLMVQVTTCGLVLVSSAPVK